MWHQTVAVDLQRSGVWEATCCCKEVVHATWPSLQSPCAYCAFLVEAVQVVEAKEEVVESFVATRPLLLADARPEKRDLAKTRVPKQCR